MIITNFISSTLVLLTVFLYLRLIEVQSYKLDLAKGAKYILKCDDINRSFINKTTIFPNVSLVIFDWCAPPNVSYSNILSKLNINPSTIQKLELRIIPSNLLLKPDHFEGLSLFNNMLSVKYQTTHELDPEIFAEIAVNELHLERVELKTLRKFRVKKTTLREGKFVGEWGDCSTLESLTLIGFNASKVLGGWLGNCSHLTDLTIKNVLLEESRIILMGAQALINLVIEECEIVYLMKPFAEDAVNLKQLVLNEPMLKYITVRAFSALKKLEKLNISRAHLSGMSIFQAITPLENLRKLIINKSPVETFCTDYYQYSTGTPTIRKIIRGIESLNLQFSLLSSICFYGWLNLTYLNLRNNKISTLDITELPVPQKRPLTVDLRDNPLIRLTESVMNTGILQLWKEKFNKSQDITIILDLNVNCDCEYTLFVEALRRLPQIRLKNATCTSGQRLVNFTGEKFRCDKYACEECTCRTSWDDHFTIVDCSSRRLSTFPAIWQYLRWTANMCVEKIVVKKISAMGNFIKTLPAIDIDTYFRSHFKDHLFESCVHSENFSLPPANEYPMTLDEIDLRKNHISRLSESALNALFSGGKRRVYLSGNPFVCDCEAQAMLDALGRHSNQIPDYKHLKCTYKNRNSYIHELSDRSLCAERLLVMISTISVSLLALPAIMTLLYLRYKLTIKAFLYARGLCLYCVTEEELDADKEYDAFISFAGLDDILVAEELLPGLENDYKLCVHTRNWMPGEEIYTQIIASVEQSRRTIIVLTKNFVKSVWGMVEFHTAYVNALREGRVRVICIMVDEDINDMDLAPELKTYLKNNTYLNLRDPWFWPKLRYALPHPSVTKQSGARNENKYQEIKLTSKQDDK